MKMVDGEWNMTAGTMADLPGRCQTVPRADLTAFAIAIEDDDGAELVNPIFAVGNGFADALATVAAEPGMRFAPMCDSVHDKRWPIADADPWCAERPPTAKPKVKTNNATVMAEKSKHDTVKLKNKWFCTACWQYVTADALQELVDTQCETTFVIANEIVDVKGDRVMGNGKLHTAHTVSEWTKYGLLLCAECVAHGTTIGKGLREKCEEVITKNGQDALNRIRDGRYLGYRGLPDMKSLKHGVGFIEWGKLWRQFILQMESTQCLAWTQRSLQDMESLKLGLEFLEWSKLRRKYTLQIQLAQYVTWPDGHIGEAVVGFSIAADLTLLMGRSPRIVHCDTE
ncbi:unnamed protein product [Prorocentrum cordatum]|uniref:Uncharacterized protein n=1 Tax=Prorocentrum cordatum TaxID=2364126 RepID=A0ABN9RVP4_9DINO|nr:unnamed protein product [Polarella glacialis]